MTPGGDSARVGGGAVAGGVKKRREGGYAKFSS
mgnify:CR=1 FL=1